MQDALIEKFENDVKTRSRFWRVLLVIDQFINVLFWNGSQDETTSSHIGRRIQKHKANKFELLLCKMLSKIEKNHCNKSRGE